MTRASAALTLPLALLALAACGSAAQKTHAAATATPGTTSRSATPSATATSSLGAVDLAALIAPAPAGFHRSTDSSDDNGTINSTDFDKLTDTGDAARLGYSTGQAVTYTDGTASVEYDLLRFATAEDATSFVGIAKADDGVAGTAPTTGTDAAIPGSVVVSPTTDAASGDQVEYDLFAPVRDGLVVVTSYYVDHVTPTGTATLESYAQVQVARL